MTNFQKQFQEYNWNLLSLSQNEKELKLLIKIFDEAQDFDFLLTEFQKYDFDKNYIEFINCFEIFQKLENKILKPENKKTLIIYLKELVNNGNKNLLFYPLHLLSKYYTEDNQYYIDLHNKYKKDPENYKKFIKQTWLTLSEIFHKLWETQLFIEIFLKYIEIEKLSIDTFSENFNRILTLELEDFKFMLEEILKSNTLTAEFLYWWEKYSFDKDRKGDQYKNLIERIEWFNDEEIKNILKKIIFKGIIVYSKNPVEYNYTRIIKTKFFFDINRYLNNSLTDYLKNFIDELFNLGSEYIIWENLYVVAQIINSNQIDDLVKTLKEKNEKKYKLYLRNIYNGIYDRENDVKTAIRVEIEAYPWMKEYLEEAKENERKAIENSEQNQKQWEDTEKNKISQLIDEWKEKLFKWEKSISPRLFGVFLAHEDFFTAEQKEILKQTVKIFFESEKWDPKNASFEYIEKNGNRNTYQRDWYVAPNVFMNAFECGKKLWVKLASYKDKFIYYIPFAFSGDLEKLFEEIDTVKNKHIDYMFNIYENKENDLRYFSFMNFLEFRKKYQENFNENYRKRFLEIIKGFIEDDSEPDTYETKKYILEEASKNDSYDFGKNFLDKIFENNNWWLNYFNDLILWSLDWEIGNKFKIASLCNEILISKHHQDKAIKWRINQLLEWETKYKEIERDTGDVRYISQVEKELSWNLSFIKIFGKIGKLEYKKMMLEVLERSFKLKKERWKGFPYITYLQDAFLKYLNGLETNDQIKLIKDISKLIQKYDEDATYEFRWKYRNILTKFAENLDENSKNELIITLIDENSKIYTVEQDYAKLRDKYRESEEKISNLSKIIEEYHYNIVLFVEWPSDKYFLERASQVLKYDKKFDIIPFHWTNNMDLIIQDVKLYWIEDKLYIFMFDFDNGGFNKWNSRKSKLQLLYSDIKKWLCYKYKKNIYCSLLPISNDKLKNQVIDDKNTQVKYHWTFWDKSEYEIESNFYWLNDELDKCFIKENRPWWWELIKPDKDNKSNKVLNEIKNNNYWEEIFINIKAIFDLIDKIIQDFNSNNN